ncbi:MAG TPA: CAP domain-containing protein [Pirellulales bacterium]|jgi:uncharacterized protein YkwD|nr:CAP domain-containing protein [Pirellulales bacterium]
MSKLSLLLALVVSFVVAIPASQTARAETPVTKPAIDLYPVETQILKQTNAERARYGLPALTLDQGLLSGARTHAAWMASSSNFSHSNMNVAENIAMGQGTAAEAMRDWMNSPGHRANILNASYTRVGIAAYVGAGGTIYWCQQFMW